ncbi:MAG TPA: hypothetical protein VJ385_06380 [Fibrobacteria bacterium]|nr:hypothetical protein [Fibrobacteria bacterium]
MKLNEFEEKLATVSDAKLRQMLASSRANGPEVAVKLILAEGRRRGMDGLEPASPAAAGLSDAPRAPGAETAAYPQEHAGYAGADAPPVPPAEAAGDASEAPATAPNWLNEETKSGMPVIAKVLILLVGLGAILAVAWKYAH